MNEEEKEVSFSSTPGEAFLKGVRSYRELMEIWEKIGEREFNFIHTAEGENNE